VTYNQSARLPLGRFRCSGCHSHRGLGPFNPGIKAGNTEAAISVLIGNAYLPDHLRGRVGSYFLNDGDLVGDILRHVVFEVAVGEPFGVSAAIGIDGREIVFRDDLSGVGELVQPIGGDAAVARRIARVSADARGRVGHAEITVVEEQQVEDSGRIRTDKVGVNAGRSSIPRGLRLRAG